MRPTRILLLGLIVVVLLPAVAEAQNTTCYRGGALLPNYTLNNATLSGTDILVTPDLGNQNASVFFNPTFDTSKNLYVKMVFKITTTTGGGADGMAFVLQNDTRGVNAIGQPGEGIGYGQQTGPTPVITPSVVVEFDTYLNGSRNDPSDNHIGLMLNGNPTHPTTPPTYLKDLAGTGYVLKSNAPMYAWLDYIASTHTLSVYLNNVNTKPSTAMLTTTAINLATQLGSKFYMGFSGSTGGEQSKHEVMEFYASDSSALPESECCNTNSDCASSSLGPVCDTQKHVCGQCTVSDISNCTPQTQPWGCDLSGVYNICVHNCDGNYLSGATHACVSANFPFCRLSGPGAGSCEVCAGDYGAGSSPACGVNSPYCSLVGYCGFCTTNADCTPAVPPHTGVVCNTANGRCVQCVSSLDCTNPTTPVCSSTTNTCVACSGNYGSGGNACQTTTLPACLGTGACVECKTTPLPADTTACTATGATCDNNTHQCTSCDGDYGSIGHTHPCGTSTKPVCILSSGVCVQCTTANAAQCTGTTPVCNAVTNTCGACNGDYGSGQSLACTSAALPACRANGACVQCSAFNSTACSGITPVCNTGTYLCAACNGDFGSGTSRACPLSSAPACITSGALTGSCKQCSSTNTSLCLAPDQCHQSGACNTSTGLCTFPNKTDGTGCNDGNLCSQTDTCQSGTCTGSNPVVCSALDQCHQVGTCHPSTGVCSNPIKTDGTTCNDGNLCTQTDTCVSGTCTGSNPVVCSALDQCHDVGVCNTSTGACSNPNKSNGIVCNDGNACTQTDTCQAGTCTGANPIICTPIDQCHQAGVCDPISSLCSDPIQPNGTTCNDGNACTQSDTCQTGVCTGSNPVVCSALDQCHDVGVCNTATGICSNPNKTNGTVCNDGNACTQTDTCQSGTCTGSNPVVCSALDQCHDLGVCNTSTGACSNPNKTNGTTCNDGNACTQTDTCQSGTCTGSNPVVCSALDQCHDLGVCNTSTGVCSNPNKTNGTTCNDGNACTQTDTCQTGICTGSNPVVCSALDQCHDVGVCNTSTGVCSNPNKTNGTVCNDGNACTQTDTCQTGICSGSNSVVCSALDQCHNVGVCNSSTGICSNPNKTNGTVCNDGNACTQTDTCQTGVCTGSNPVVCSALDQCHDVGVCNTSTGACSNPNKTNGTVCNDGNACTQTDTCQSGICSGSNPVVCSALDQCHDVGVCNSSTGICSNPNKTNGTVCNDGNACTQTDTCQTGVCTGSNPVVCSALDQCHDVGVCNTSTGACSNPNKTNGTTCNDGNACTQTDTCQAGTCSGSNPVVCSALDQCHDVGVCNSSTGICSNPNKTNGTTCNDGNACTQTDTCQAGTCTGGNPVLCSALDQCHLAGVCNTTNGVCSNPNKTDGTVCNDGDACTQTDSCLAGLCVGSTPVVCPLPDQCHLTGVCDSSSGGCLYPNKLDDTTCNDGNACTQTDTCQTGVCAGSNPVSCSALDQCHDVGVCNTSTGICSNPNKTNGTTCNDGNACTQTDTCQTGVCAGSNPVSCSALDQCHVAGTCNTSTGTCSNPSKPDGDACNDGNACTQTDTCQTGTCTGVNPVVCSALDQCHDVGVCNTTTGICSNPSKPDGDACNDGDACTLTDTCTAGVCAGVPIVCVAQDECHTAGTCDQLTGCSNPIKPDGAPCASGLGQCLAGVCNGQSCTDSSECPSTHCVDGVCCESACAGQCEACNLPGSLGHCGAVAGMPQSPRLACSNDPLCGGHCDGTVRTTCTYPDGTTACRAAQCVQGVATVAAFCDGAGACPPIQTQSCDPYICGPSQCLGDCLVDQDCITGYFCSAGICQPTLPPGQLCNRNVQCISGHCVDNTCCDLPCIGQCEACNLPASLGACTAVSGAPVGARLPCYSDGGVCGGYCDGQKRDECFYPWTEIECRAVSCQSGVATVRAVCDGAGFCPPLHTQPCDPYRCGPTQCQGNCMVDEDCPSGFMCSAGVCVPKHDPGTDCAGDNECLSGLCVDGVCCNQACLGQCEACNLENHRGTCTPVTGAPQRGRAPCVGTGTGCGGSCDGITANHCSYPGAETVCRLGSCQNGVATLQASCDNAGHCPDILQRNCSPSICNGDLCLGNCTSDTDCPANQFCSGGVCVSKIPLGNPCDSAAHCASGLCVDGVCCNLPCSGQCEACNLVTHEGYCLPVSGVPSGSRAPCVGERACQGSCDGTTRDACTFLGTAVICQNAICADGIASAAATCDGAGTCLVGGSATQSCGAYVCGETTCKTSCTTDKDCTSEYYCKHSHCTDSNEVSGGGCNCGTGGNDRSGLLLVLLGLLMLAILRRVR